MSDATSRLLLRAAGTLPVARPLLPSRFAPGGAEPAELRSVPTAADAAPPAEHRLPQHTFRRTSETVVAPRRPAAQRPPSFLGGELPSVSVSSPTANPAVEPGPEAAPEAAQNNPSAPEPSPPPVTTSPAPQPPVTPTPMRPPTIATLPPAPAARPDALARSPEPAARREVRIAIGRVEVHLAQPAALPVPRAAARRAMSLADYLARTERREA